MPDADIDWVRGEWQRYRNSLIDLTRRNRLLHFNHSGRSPPLRLVNAGPDKVLTSLLDGRKLRFAPLPDPDGALADEQTQRFKAALSAARLTDVAYRQAIGAIASDAPDAEDKEAVAERGLADRVRHQLGLHPRPARRQHSNLASWAIAQGIDPALEPAAAAGDDPPILQTLLLPQSLDARLTRLVRQVAAVEAETGVSTLHLAFGFLEWRDNTPGGEVSVSPLLLLPVALSPIVTGGVRSFALVSHDAEAKENIALRLRLKKDLKRRASACPRGQYFGGGLRQSP
jgi:hypothetical protein